jgi:hypothetical protein
MFLWRALTNINNTADATAAPAPAVAASAAAALRDDDNLAPPPPPPPLLTPALADSRHAAAASPAQPPASLLLLQRVTADAVCAICLDIAVAPHVLPCTHSFCGACLARLLAPRGRPAVCPTCRAPAGVPRYERALDAMLTALYASQDAEEEDLDDANEERGRRQRAWAAAEAATRAEWGANPLLSAAPQVAALQAALAAANEHAAAADARAAAAEAHSTATDARAAVAEARAAAAEGQIADIALLVKEHGEQFGRR